MRRVVNAHPAKIVASVKTAARAKIASRVTSVSRARNVSPAKNVSRVKTANRARSVRPEAREDRRPRYDREERVEASEGDGERGPRRQRQPRNTRADNDRVDNEPLGIDLAVLPPAIGIEPAKDDVRDEAPVAEEAAPAPKRRGRPRKVVVEEVSDNGTDEAA